MTNYLSSGGSFKSSNNEEIQKIADFAVNHPKFLPGHCKQKRKAKVLEHETQIVAGTRYKLDVEVKMRANKECDSEYKVVCKDLRVFKPLPAKCYAFLGQKPKKIRRGSALFLEPTNACDEVDLSDLSCRVSIGKLNQLLKY